MYLNAQSINNKQNELESLLLETPVEYLCIVEHWMSPDSHINLSGMCLVSKFCRKISKNNAYHGGAGIFVNEAVIKECEQIDVSKISEEISFEATVIKNYKEKLVIATIYRSTAAKIEGFDGKLEELLNFICIDNYNVIVVGDFNVNFDHAESRNIVNLFLTYNLKRQVYKPTRGKRCIENIFTNFVNPKVTVNEEGMSDHNIVNMNFEAKFTSGIEGKRLTKQTRALSRNNKIKFASLLKSERWEEVIENNEDAERAFQAFHDKISVHYNEAFPLKEMNIRTKTDKRWFNEEVKKARSEKIDLYHLAKMFPMFIPLYLLAQNNLRRVINKAKKDYYGNLVESSNNKIKTMWKTINEQLGTGSTNTGIETIECDGITVTNTCEITNKFNNYFLTAPKELSKKCQGRVDTQTHSNGQTKCNDSEPTLTDFNETRVDANEVRKVVSTLRNSTASGYDDFNTKLVKESINYLAPILVFLFNLILSSGVFPSALKIAKVVPIYKKGEKTKVENYRPISVLSVFSKIMEKLIYSRLINFLTRTKALSPTQHGFTKGKSTATAVNELVKIISNNIKKGRWTLVVCLDLSKAFDLVNHTLLLKKLEQLGIRDKAINLLKSYLTDRKQFVQLKNNSGVFKSEVKFSEIGVPQGGVLAPLLFIIYVNALAKVIKEKMSVEVIQYADDTTIAISSDSLEHLVLYYEELMQVVVNFFAEIELVLNKDKTNIMLFGKNLEISKIVLTEAGLTLVNTIKLLGVYLDEKLKWGEQTNKLANKLASMSYLMRKIRKFLTPEALRAIYFAHVQSHLAYNILAWGDSSGLDAVLVGQKRVLRAMLGLKSREHCREYFSSQKILTVPSLFILELTYVVKTNNDFIKFQRAHSYNTRDSSSVQLTSVATEVMSANLADLGARLYNKLPKNIRETESPGLFFSNTKKLLLQKVYYTLKEFLEDPL